ncbi:MAG: twin-arginine translocation signal domain-containing protein, partial [Anaerolineaceae bacterium]
MGNTNSGLSRRDFLKLSGLGLLGLLAPGQPLSFFSDL